MNEARLGVGIQGLGITQAAYGGLRRRRRARPDGPAHSPASPVAGMLLDIEATVAGLRALTYEACGAFDLVNGLGQRLAGLPPGHPERRPLQARRQRLERYLRELTPLVKYYGAEEALCVARQALQVHGGYGVIKDYEVERLLRESFILSIYEGTSQIQSLMAVKDLLCVVLPRPVRLWCGPTPALAEARLDGALRSLYRQALGDLTVALRYLVLDLVRSQGPAGTLALARQAQAPSDREAGYILLYPERVTQMLAHLHAARLLAQQAARFPERQPLARRLLRRAAHVARTNRSIIESGDREPLEAIAGWRAPAP